MKEPKFYKDSRKNSTPEGIFSLANMDYGELDSEGILSSANQRKKELDSEGILSSANPDEEETRLRGDSQDQPIRSFSSSKNCI